MIDQNAQNDMEQAENAPQYPYHQSPFTEYITELIYLSAVYSK